MHEICHVVQILTLKMHCHTSALLHLLPLSAQHLQSLNLGLLPLHQKLKLSHHQAQHGRLTGWSFASTPCSNSSSCMSSSSSSYAKHNRLTANKPFHHTAVSFLITLPQPNHSHPALLSQQALPVFQQHQSPVPCSPLALHRGLTCPSSSTQIGSLAMLSLSQRLGSSADAPGGLCQDCQLLSLQVIHSLDSLEAKQGQEALHKPA